MNNNLTLSVTLSGDGRQLSGTLRDAQGEVREFTATTERESKKAETALQAPGRQAGTVSEHLRGAQQEARTFGTETTQGGRQATQALAQTGQEAQTVTSQLGQLKAMAIGVGVAFTAMGVRDFINDTYAAVSSSQQLQASLKTVTGSLGSATKAWNELLVFAAETPFTLDQSVQAFIRMQALGLNPTQAALRSFGNTAAAMGEDMMRMVEAVADATTGEFERLKAFGIRSSVEGEQIAFTFQGVTTRIRNSAADISAYLQSIGENQFAGSMADQMATLNGQSANLEDSIYQLYLAIGDAGATQMFEKALGSASNTVQFLTDNIDTLATGAEVIAVLLGGRVLVALGSVTAAKLAATQQTIAYQLALARMAGVSTAATAGQVALAGATRATAGAMALVGGPLGAAMLAGGAIFYFREELGLVAPKVQTATDRVDDMTSALDANSEAALKNARAMLEAEQMFQRFRQTSLAMDVERQQQIVFDEQEQWNSVGGQQAFGMGQRSESQQKLHDLRVELMDTRNAIEAAGGSVSEIDEKLEQLERTTRQVITPTVDLGDATESAGKKSKDAAKETATLAGSYEDLLDRIQPNRRAARQYAQDLGTLNLALATGRMSTSQYMQALGQLHELFQEGQRETEKLATTSERASDRIANSFTTWGTIADNTLRSVDDSGRDAWLGLVDGSTSALDTVERAFQQTIANILHMLTTQQFTFQVAGMMGLDTTGMPGGSSGGFGINPGSINNAWQALQGGIGGIQWGGVGSASAYGGTGFANAATSGLGQTGFMGGSLNNFSGMQGLAGLGAGLAGNWLGGQLFGQGKHSSTLGTIGGAVGTYFGGPLGALAGSTLGSALGGIFGGSWKTKDAGLNLGISAGDITGNQFENQRKSGGWFSSSKSRTRTSALNGELEAMLQDAYAAQEASLAVTLETLGQQSSALNAFSSGLTRISTKGLDEAEVEQAVQEWLQNVVNSAAQSVADPSQYARAGETTVDTLSRLATALNGINPILEQLHETSLAASLAGGDAASQLAELAGGIDAFSARADYYYQNVLTEAERQERAMNAAAQAMGTFTARTGRVIESTDALRELVDGIDLTTASGRELYNQAMNLAPALVEIERGLERVGQQFEQMLADASAVVSDAEAQVRQAWQTFDRQSFSQQIELLNLMGDSQGALALERERELATIDEALRPTQERIWAIQDEIAAQQNVTAAARNYQRELSSVRDQLNQQFANIGNWLDQQQATSGSPETNLATAQEQLARQLVLAENGDRNALQNITQYAQQVLEANKAYNASSAAGQRIQQDVYDAIRALPESISAEQYLAEEIRNALFDALDGKATNDELQALMTRVVNGDMTLEAALQRVYGVSEGTEANTDSMEKQARNQLRELNGLVGEMTRTTDQFVGLNATMVSLQGSINALGVANEEIARIEREKADAEKAERDRIEKERKDTLAAQRKAMNGELSSLKALYSDYQQTIAFNQDPNATGSETRGGLAEHYKYHSNVRLGASSLDDLLSGSYAYNYRPELNTSKRVNRLLGEYNNAVQGIGSVEREIERLMASLNSMPKFAKGGVFTGSIVSSPTTFDMGLMGEAGPEAIVPLHMGSEGLGIKDYSSRNPILNKALLPSLPFLDNSDVIETLRDLKREVAELRRDNRRLQGESNRHLSAANNQRGAAAKGQIGAIERSNKLLKRLEDDKRLEAAKR